jgi:hypothetical protein
MNESSSIDDEESNVCCEINIRERDAFAKHLRQHDDD